MGRQKKQHLKQRADGRYRCAYKGKQFYGNTEAEALAARDEYKRLESMNQICAEHPTVAEYGNRWLPVNRPTASKATYRGLACHLEKLIRQIGDLLVEEVKPSDIKRVYSVEYLNDSNSYILNGKQLFCSMFDAAVADGLLRFNPARDKTALPHQGSKGGHRAITDQERTWINTLCKDHRCHAAAMTMLYAGVRPQEVKAMHMDCIDFDNDVIHLAEFAHLDGYYKYKITEQGKTDNAKRDIPLLSILKDTLKGRSGYIVTDAKGKRVNVQAWKSLWASYKSNMEKAINGCPKRWYGRTKEHKAILAEGGKLPPWVEFTVVPYDLRHSFCVMCRDHGVELHTCVEWMGHADAKMIMKIYDEVSDQRSRTEAQKLEKMFAKKTQKKKGPKK